MEFKNQPKDGYIIVFENEKAKCISKESFLLETKHEILQLKAEIMLLQQQVSDLVDKVKELRGEE